MECDVGNYTFDWPMLTGFLTGRSVKATEVSGGLAVPDSLQLEGEVELAPRFDGRCFVDGSHGTQFPFRSLREIEETSAEHLTENAGGSISSFRHYLAQRQAVESVIWLHVVRRDREKYDLLRFDVSGGSPTAWSSRIGLVTC